MKKLSTFIFFVAAIAFCILVFLVHIDLFKALPNADFSSADGIKAFVVLIIILLVDVAAFAVTLVSFLGFLFSIGNAKGYKHMIKCTATVGGYFAALMVAEFLVLLFAAIGTSDMNDVLALAKEKNFYTPLAMSIIAGIVLLIARIISRGGIAGGVLVLLGAGLLIAMNIIYFRTEMTTALPALRFWVCIAALALSIIPGFIPQREEKVAK